MKPIRSRKHAHTFPASLLTTSLMAVAGSLSAAAHADDVRKEAPALGEVKVQAAAEAAYKADRSASPKLSQPLVDTPKTVQVLKKEMLQEQGAVSLMEALRNTPGITMQLGENGNTSAGDTFQMRGFSTQTSTFVDGVRDLGVVSRDVFNLEQIEVIKGAAGSETGRGSSSGYINLISKLPTLEESSEIILTAGTDQKQRLSLDQTKKLDGSSALRLNVMVQEADAAGRDAVHYESVGIAPSLAFGLGTPTRLYVFSQHVRQSNVPDGGIPTIGMSGFYANPVYNHDNDSDKAATATTPAVTATPTRTTPEGDALAAAYQSGARVNRANFYGSRQDKEQITADMFTVKLEKDLDRDLRLINTSRVGRSDMQRVLTGVNGPSLSMAAVGKYTDPVNLTGFTPGTNNPLDPSTWTVNRSVQSVDQQNEILANTTSLLAGLTLAGMRHDLVAGLELMQESQRNNTLAAASTPVANLYNPSVSDAFVLPVLTGAFTDGKTQTAALYVSDTLTLTETLKLNAGVRADRFKTTTEIGTVVTAANSATYPGVAVGGVGLQSLDDQDTLLSWNVGLVFKPAANGSVYVSIADTQTPPGGANFALSATATNQANSAFDPQQTTTLEVGSKWELMKQRLNLSVAAYRTENDGQVTQDPVSAVYSQDGKTRVDGLELALVGQLTNFWQVSAGVAVMDTQSLDQVSVNSTTKAVTTTRTVRWTPDMAASVWTSYTLGDLTLGGGVRYLSEQKRLVTDANPATQNMAEIPAYSVVDIMAAYKVSKALNLRLNVNNVLDEEYIQTLNNSGARMTLGAPVTAALSAEFRY